MKKKITLLFVCLCLAATFVLTGCSSISFSKIKVGGEKQNTDYTVYSNGGNSVQYGNYIYFINGTKGYADEDGKQNVWGDVLKGGLYRAELKGEKNGSEFEIKADDKGGEFKLKDDQVYTDYDGNPIDVVNVELIAPKVIGTSGYKTGGIYIYDDYVYYASPNNEKDKTGAVQVNKTDFLMSKLDGSDTKKIYTTEADSQTSQYAFYKRGDSVFLVSAYTDKLVSVKIKNGKVENPITIASGIKGSYLPTKSTYIKGDKSVSLEDYVYILRDVNTTDPLKVGNVIEVISPDGKEGAGEGAKAISTTKTDLKILGVRDGALFYSLSSDSGNTGVYFNNLHTAMMNEYVPSYKNYQDGLPEGSDQKLGQINGEIMTTGSFADYTTTYCFRPGGLQSDIGYMVGVNASGVNVFASGLEAKQVYNSTIVLNFIDEGYMYYSEGESKTLYRTEWNKSVAEKQATDSLKQQISHGEVTENGLYADMVAGYVVYMGDVDTWAKGYTFFKKVKGVDASGSKEQFVGTKIEADLKPKEEDEEEEEDKKGGCATIAPVSGFNGGIGLGLVILAFGAMMFIIKKKSVKAQ